MKKVAFAAAFAVMFACGYDNTPGQEYSSVDEIDGFVADDVATEDQSLAAGCVNGNVKDGRAIGCCTGTRDSVKFAVLKCVQHKWQRIGTRCDPRLLCGI